MIKCKLHICTCKLQIIKFYHSLHSTLVYSGKSYLENVPHLALDLQITKTSSLKYLDYFKIQNDYFHTFRFKTVNERCVKQINAFYLVSHYIQRN